jgi:hypothetical protein
LFVINAILRGFVSYVNWEPWELAPHDPDTGTVRDGTSIIVVIWCCFDTFQ